MHFNIGAITGLLLYCNEHATDHSEIIVHVSDCWGTELGNLRAQVIAQVKSIVSLELVRIDLLSCSYMLMAPYFQRTNRENVVLDDVLWAYCQNWRLPCKIGEVTVSGPDKDGWCRMKQEIEFGKLIK